MRHFLALTILRLLSSPLVQCPLAGPSPPVLPLPLPLAFPQPTCPHHSITRFHHPLQEPPHSQTSKRRLTAGAAAPLTAFGTGWHLGTSALHSLHQATISTVPRRHSSVPHATVAGDEAPGGGAWQLAGAGGGAEVLFNRLLSVFYALMSPQWAVWLLPSPSPPSSSSSTTAATSAVAAAAAASATSLAPRTLKDVPPLDGDLLDALQVELDNRFPTAGLWHRIHAAIPGLPIPPPLTISAAPAEVLPSLAASAIASSAAAEGTHLSPDDLLRLLQDSSRFNFPVLSPGGDMGATAHTATSGTGGLGGSGGGVSSSSGVTGGADMEMEVDPWILLEEGVGGAGPTLGSGPSSERGSFGHGDAPIAPAKASGWLRGAIRRKRKGLTYSTGFNDEIIR